MYFEKINDENNLSYTEKNKNKKLDKDIDIKKTKKRNTMYAVTYKKNIIKYNKENKENKNKKLKEKNVKPQKNLIKINIKKEEEYNGDILPLLEQKLQYTDNSIHNVEEKKVTEKKKGKENK